MKSKKLGKYGAFTLIFLSNILYSALGQDNVALDRLMAVDWSTKTSNNISNNIIDILQSESGYIWMATYNGIQKFDGYKNTVYSTSQLPFLRSSGFRSVYQSPFDNALYFSSQSSGIIKYDVSDGFEQLKVTKGKLPTSIQNVLIDHSGRMWIGSSNDGLYIMQGDSAYQFEHPIIKTSTVLSLCETKNGHIMIGTEGNGAYEISDNQIINEYFRENGLLSSGVNVIKAVGDSIFFGTRNGLNLLYKNEFKSVDFLNGQSVNNVTAKNGVLWLGLDNGLARINLKTQKSELISSFGDIDVSRTNNVIIDREGSIWLATGRNGLIQLRETGVINYNRFDGLESESINVIRAKATDQGYFIGSDNGSIYSLRDGEINEFEIQSDIKPTAIRDVYQQKNGIIWIASYKGLLKKNGDQEELFGLEDGLPSLDIRRILEDSKGNLWLASRSGGLIKWRDEKVLEVFDRENQLKSDFILCVEEDGEGNLYVGTNSGGVSILNSKGEIRNISITANDEGIIVFNIQVNKPNHFWAVTTAGIYLIKDKEVVKLNFEKSFDAISMFDWLEDDNGNIWITSNQGVINIAREELEKFEQNPDYQVKTRLITKADGMQNEKCTGAVQSLKSSDGRLFIPTVGGVSVITPDKMEENKILPNIFIESLETQDSTYKQTANIILSAKSNRYIFNFTALSYLSPDAIQFKYKLEGQEKNFTTISGNRSAEYTNLAPGEYQFLVYATNNQGDWTTPIAICHFVIKPAFYETIWFYLLFGAIIILLIYLIYKWRVNAIEKMNTKLMKVNSELDGFVYSASHDLRSPLASLLGLINLGRSDTQNIELYLDKMEKSVKRLDDFIAEIIDFSSNERKEVVCDQLEFEPIVDNIIEELSFLDSNERVRKNINIQQSCIFQTDKRRMAIIFRNLISNALKYYDDSKENPFLKIEIRSNSKSAHIIIEDNGIGISKNEQEEVFKMFYRATERSTGSGLGLYIVLETVEKLGGVITMSSERYKGTKFDIIIPFLNL
ncbi:hypothetical protein MATR_06490 [Marivirga tractuosa]|jgi:signal transduction histidine kinase/ligand-binding sensor domain-containing protein|uniref:histidine kinase n=1 Tax=Marivirga tractuosa (strain ATCC 23168 / DSM 4126 / NBRC 15989 / NCIMB 1408 / VKM B-1430 / H-43) TaxID=643867 RepID=E4TRJ7_MARTH|nr:sensor histidine kinase [Marivirga tractuosa]ADR21718.1 histidine kinase [Marivirga tractuosa DSM 4126]BDD13824.1 hypothetical protein MATR_06490 [Marivirga tractuosa]